jgi:hypothetical protein
MKIWLKVQDDWFQYEKEIEIKQLTRKLKRELQKELVEKMKEAKARGEAMSF